MDETQDDRVGAHVRGILPLLALDSVSDEERARVERHLAGCIACRRDLEAFERIAEDLRLATHHPPPGSVWKSIEQRIERPQVVPQATTTAVNHRRSRVVAGAAIALGVVLGFVGGFASGRFGDDNAPTPFEVAQVSTDDEVFTLVPVEPASRASGRVFMSTDRTRGVVAVTGLEQLPGDQIYAVWLVHSDDTRESVGTFAVDVRGEAIVPLWLPSAADDWEQSQTYVALSISRVRLTAPSTPLGGTVLIAPIY